MKAKPKAKRVSNRKPTPRAVRASRKNGAKNQPTDNYNAKFCGLAKWSAAAGATDVDIAKALNIGMTTFVEWEKKYPDFKQAIHEGRHEIVPNVVRSLVRRATGFTHKAVKIFYDAKAEKVVQVPYIERYAPDTAAALAILGTFNDVAANHRGVRNGLGQQLLGTVGGYHNVLELCLGKRRQCRGQRHGQCSEACTGSKKFHE